MLFHFRLRIKLRCCAPLKLKGVVPSNGFMDLFVMVIPPEKNQSFDIFSVCNADFFPLDHQIETSDRPSHLDLVEIENHHDNKNLCKTLNLMPNISHMLTFFRNTKILTALCNKGQYRLSQQQYKANIDCIWTFSYANNDLFTLMSSGISTSKNRNYS